MPEIPAAERLSGEARMAKHKRRGIFGILSVVGLSVAIMVPIQLAGTAGAAHIPYGYTGPKLGQRILQLHTTNLAGDTDRFFISGVTAQDQIANGTGSKKCQLKLGASSGSTVAGNLVTLQAFSRDPATETQSLSSWYVGFSNTDNSIGVGSETSNNTKCAQANDGSPGEVLVVKLNNQSGPNAGWFWDTLELDLEAKFGTDHVYYSLYKGGQAVTGQSGVELPICGTLTADCGPDSADGDNYRAAIPQPVNGTYPSVLFDEVRIWPGRPDGTVSNGGIDLKGGSDGTSPFCLARENGACTEWGLADDVSPSAPASVTDSLFSLVLPAEGLICPTDDPNTPQNDTQATEPTGSGTATVTYLDSSGPCKAYRLTYTRDANNNRELEFLTSDTTQTVRFEVSVADWDPEPATNPVALSKTDPAGTDNDPTGEWCGGTATTPIMPTGESWCAIEMTAHTYGPDGSGGQLIKVTEKWLLEGDAHINR